VLKVRKSLDDYIFGLVYNIFLENSKKKPTGNMLKESEWTKPLRFSRKENG
jgi:hypothetical protein